MVGRAGSVVGIDVRRQAVRLSRDNVRRLAAAGTEYAATACEVDFRARDVFLPSARLRARFDRVHVGASCPPERLGPLLALLGPGGGRIVVPVAPSDLRVITRAPDGAVTQRVLSQVRFSELEVPGDARMLLAMLRADRKARTTPAALPSTYLADLAGMQGECGGGPDPCAVRDGQAQGCGGGRVNLRGCGGHLSDGVSSTSKA